MYKEFPSYIFFNELFYFACRILWEKIDIYWWNIISWLENVSLHHLLILILLLLLHQLSFILWLWATVNLTKDKKEKKFYGFKIRLIVKVYTHKWEIRDYQLSRWQCAILALLLYFWNEQSLGYFRICIYCSCCVWIK